MTARIGIAVALFLIARFMPGERPSSFKVMFGKLDRLLGLFVHFGEEGCRLGEIAIIEPASERIGVIKDGVVRGSFGLIDLTLRARGPSVFQITRVDAVFLGAWLWRWWNDRREIDAGRMDESCCSGYRLPKK